MPGTTTSRILLGRELARLREAAGASRERAAHKISRTRNHIGNIETGRNPPSSLDELRRLASFYQASPVDLSALEHLWVDANRETWFSRFGLSESLARYVGLETDAEKVRTWQTDNIPGLLQTERYMRTLYQLDPQPRSERETNNRVLTRLHRQQRLVSDDPLTLIAVISESALDRCAHAGTVGRGQLTQLRQRAAWPNVELRVLATEVGLHAGQDGPFSLLSFPGQLLPDMVFEEGATGGHLTDAPSAVAECHTLFEELRSQALNPDESMAKIAKLLEP